MIFRSVKIILLARIILMASLAGAADMILDEKDRYFKAYYTQSDSSGWDVELKGRIILIGADYKAQRDISEKIENKTNASVRLYNNLGFGIGDTLYVIGDNNLIIARAAVESIFATGSFGYMMTIKGNLSLVNTGDRVVLRSEKQLKNPLAYNGKGDFYKENGRPGKAISFYKNALEADNKNPEAHLALGYIYLNDDILEHALNEFMEARKYIRRMYDNEDKYYLYRGLAEVRFKQAYYLRLSDDLRNKYINEGIDYCTQALRIYPDSKEVNYYLGVFYYKNSNPIDVKAKDQFQKVIDINPDNIEAYIALAELYEKHDNKEKAASYAGRALKIDPMNERAKYILKRIK